MEHLHEGFAHEPSYRPVTIVDARQPKRLALLIDAANEAGGRDNVTVVLLRYAG